MRSEKIDAIWGGDASPGRQQDVLGRRREAEQLIAYIESVVGRDSIREDKRAYTIAVDAPYGEGKTFFLRRLAEHLALEHPVAYVDAWADDLTDEPLIALAATLKSAIEPLLQKPDVQERFSDFMSKAGKVAKIVGWGLVRRGASLAISGAAVHAVEQVVSGVSDDLEETVIEGMRDVGEGGVEDTTAAVADLRQHASMERRIGEFEESKAAVQQMKESLKAVIDSLQGNEISPPIVIVIDELDRCRPTYAIRLLEEIKHLFDVSGLVFVLGLHGDQLGHSVSGAYGAGFDGRGYLRRFIDREYRLARPKLTRLMDVLLSKAALDARSLSWPQIVMSNTRELKPNLSELLSEYISYYGLGARDAFELVDILQTSEAIADGDVIQLPYFLPLAIGMMKGLPIGELPEQVHHSAWAYMPNWSQTRSDVTEFDFFRMSEAFENAMKLSAEQLETQLGQHPTDYVSNIVLSHRRFGPENYPNWSVFGYRRLLGEVSRFKNPRIETG